MGNVSVSWQKTFHEEDKSPRNESSDVLALSAFMLSSLPTPVARKQVVKEMWESGANMIVSFDVRVIRLYSYMWVDPGPNRPWFCGRL